MLRSIVMILALLAGAATASAEKFTILVGAPMWSPYGKHVRVIGEFLPRYLGQSAQVESKVMDAALGMSAARYAVQLGDENLLLFIPPGFVWNTVFQKLPQGEQPVWEFPPIGVVTKQDHVCVSAKPVTLDDLRTKKVQAGAIGARMLAAITPRVYNGVLGTNINVVTGYKKWADIMFALQRGELDILCGVDSSYMAEYYPEVLAPPREKGLRVVFIEGFRTDPRFPHAARLVDKISDDRAREVIGNVTKAHLGRMLFANPHMSKETVARVRSAFDRMMDDPAYQKAVGDIKLVHSPMKSAEFVDAMGALKNVPPTVWADIDRLIQK